MPAPDGAVVELRRYVLHPGRRDDLVELFDRELVEPQEALGMRILGQFRQPDEPDRFVWLRGYPDLATRASALPAFYGGPVWARHSEAANATMADWSDVLLLRPVAGRADVPAVERPPPGEAGEPGGGTVVVTVCRLDEPPPPDDELVAGIVPAGALAAFVTLEADNPFPVLPVREGEHVVVWVSRHEPLAPSGPAAGTVEHLVLEPTARSAMR